MRALKRTVYWNGLAFVVATMWIAHFTSANIAESVEANMSLAGLMFLMNWGYNKVYDRLEN